MEELESNDMNIKSKGTTCMMCGKNFKKASQLDYHVRRIHYQEKNHVCATCSKAFFKKSDLDAHSLIHSNSFKCICKICGRSFKHVSNLNRHIRTHTGEKPYLCSICQKRFSQVAALQQHLQTEQHKIKSSVQSNPSQDIRSFLDESNSSPSEKNKKWWFYCSACDRRFQFVQQLREHEVIHENNGQFLCTACDSKFDTNNLLKNHCCINDPRKHTAKNKAKSFNLRVSSQSNTPGDTNKNKDSVDNEWPTQTEEPSATNVTSVELTLTQNGQILLDNNEVLLTLKDKMYGVVLVNNDVTIMENNTAHRVLKSLSEAHKPREETQKLESIPNGNENSMYPLVTLDSVENIIKNIEVTEENNSTASLPEISDTHCELNSLDESVPLPREVQLMDEKEKLLVFEWWMLNQKPDSKTSLNTNQYSKIDSEKRRNRFICSECGRIFNKKNNYQQHLGTHFTHQMKHECPVCGRHFAWKSTVVKHISRVHEDRTPYTCDQCGRVYHSSVLVQYHIQRDHLNIKSHHCTNCGKSFFRKYDLKLHFRKHSNERPYMCGACGKTFRHPSHVVRHERLHQKTKMSM